MLLPSGAVPFQVSQPINNSSADVAIADVLSAAALAAKANRTYYVCTIAATNEHATVGLKVSLYSGPSTAARLIFSQFASKDGGGFAHSFERVPKHTRKGDALVAKVSVAQAADLNLDLTGYYVDGP